MQVLAEEIRALQAGNDALTQEREYSTYRFAAPDHVSQEKGLAVFWRGDTDRSADFSHYFSGVFRVKFIQKFVVPLVKIPRTDVRHSVFQREIPEISGEALEGFYE